MKGTFKIFFFSSPRSDVINQRLFVVSLRLTALRVTHMALDGCAWSEALYDLVVRQVKSDGEVKRRVSFGNE